MSKFSELYLSSNIRVGFADGTTWLLSDSKPQNPETLPNETTFVITACNPKSQEATLQQNHLNTLALEDDLIKNGLEYHIGWGTSEDNLHAELSFCVPVREPEALDATLYLIRELAIKFEQNAIFEISETEVKLIPCLDPTAIGAITKYATRLEETQESFKSKLGILRWAAEADPRDFAELDRFIINHQPPFDDYDL